MDTTTPAPLARPSRCLGHEWRRALSLSVGIALIGLAGCPGPSEQPYRIVSEGLDEGLFSVSGTSSSDVWAVGADRDRGAGPLVLHWDGSAWERHATGASGDLWWVHPVAGGPVFLGGEDGMILRREGTTFERMTTPSSGVIVFGIWAAAPNDVYAVGGAGSSAGFVWHFDGTAWSTVEIADHDAAEPVFKVWGTSATDVWICGYGGLLEHFDGTAWTRLPSTTTRTLLTLHTIPGQLTAVGGAGTGVLVERGTDGTIHDATPELAPQLMGVWLTQTGGRASGINGALYRREGGAWVEEDTNLGLSEQLHSVWIDPEGGVWSVGGQILSEPFVDGVILHQGEQVVTPVE